MHNSAGETRTEDILKGYFVCTVDPVVPLSKLAAVYTKNVN
jgi:hypothetical protein